MKVIYAQGTKMDSEDHEKVCFVLIPPMNFWTFKPGVKPHHELWFLLIMTTRPSAIFILKGANLFQQPASFIGIEDLNEIELLDFHACLRSTS